VTAGGAVPFGGQFDADGNATVTAPRVKKTSLSLTLKLDTVGAQQVTGNVSDGTNWTVNILADRAVFGGRNPSRFAGNYTFTWSGNDNDPAGSPGGDTFGTVLANRAGNLVAVTRLADTFTTTQVVPISKDGNWPMFSTLYGKEIVIGWVHVDTNLTGTVNWIKTPMTIGTYRAGFSNTVSLTGSAWVAPKARGATGLNLSASPILTLTGGNLGAGIAPTITFNPINLTFSSTSPSLTMKLTSSTGLFSGRFTDPATSRVRKFNGVMLQNQNNARGFFLGSDQSGAVRLDNP